MTNNKHKNNIIYQPGTQEMLQNVQTKDFLLSSTVESQSMVDDGQVLSYVIKTDKGYITTRNKRFLRPLPQAIDPKIQQKSEDTNLPPSDSMGPTTQSVPLRRSKRAGITTQSEECQNKGIFNYSAVFDDTTRIATQKTPLRRSWESHDGEIILHNPADQT